MPEAQRLKIIASKLGKPPSVECQLAAARANVGNKHNFKGDSVKYRGLHAWLVNNKQKPETCENCGASGRLEIANINGHKYTRNLSDYMYLCVKCHRDLDGAKYNLPQYRRNE